MQSLSPMELFPPLAPQVGSPKPSDAPTTYASVAVQTLPLLLSQSKSFLDSYPITELSYHVDQSAAEDIMINSSTTIQNKHLDALPLSNPHANSIAMLIENNNFICEEFKRLSYHCSHMDLLLGQHNMLNNILESILHANTLTATTMSTSRVCVCAVPESSTSQTTLKRRRTDHITPTTSSSPNQTAIPDIPHPPSASTTPTSTILLPPFSSTQGSNHPVGGRAPRKRPQTSQQTASAVASTQTSRSAAIVAIGQLQWSDNLLTVIQEMAVREHLQNPVATITLNRGPFWMGLVFAVTADAEAFVRSWNASNTPGYETVIAELLVD